MLGQKILRVSKHSVRNLFEKPPEPRVEDLYRAKMRLNARLRVKLVHRGASVANKTLQNINFRKEESQESFDPTRTHQGALIEKDSAIDHAEALSLKGMIESDRQTRRKRPLNDDLAD